jgi:hypothetical protein
MSNLPAIRVPIIAGDGYSAALNKFSAKIGGLGGLAARLRSGMGGIAKIGSLPALIGGAVGGISIASVMKDTIDFGDSIDKATRLTGLGARSFQTLAYAAKMADIEQGEFTADMAKFSRAVAESIKPGTNAAQMFSALGVKTVDAAGKIRGIDDILLDSSEAFRKIESPALRAKVAFGMFGKQGSKMSELLLQGRDAINAAREKGGLLALSDEDIAAAAAFDDQLKNLSATWTAATRKFAVKAFPALGKTITEITDKLVIALPKIEAAAMAFAENLPSAIDKTFAAGKVVLPVIKGIVSFIGKVAKVVGPANLALGIMGITLATTVVPAIISAATSLQGLGAAVSLNPIVLAVVGLGAAVFTTYQHFANLNSEMRQADEMNKKFGRGPVKISMAETEKTKKLGDLMNLYKSENWTPETLAQIKSLESDLSKQGFKIPEAQNERVQYVNDQYTQRVASSPLAVAVGNAFSSAGTPQAQPSKSEVTVKFENAPKGTRIASLNTDTNTDLDVDMGYALQ